MRTPEEKPEVVGFDFTVTHRDPKTGLVIRRDPYIQRVCAKEAGGNTRYLERPPGSGNLWNKQNEPIGRWDISAPEGKRFIAGAEHAAFVKPQTEDEKLAKAVIQRDNENATLRAEVLALKAEAAKRADSVKQADSPKVAAQDKKKQQES